MWTVRSQWRPILGETEPFSYTDTYGDRRDARKRGLRLTCLRGVTAVDVFDPDGAVVAHWRREDNVWHDTPPPDDPQKNFTAGNGGGG